MVGVSLPFAVQRFRGRRPLVRRRASSAVAALIGCFLLFATSTLAERRGTAWVEQSEGAKLSDSWRRVVTPAFTVVGDARPDQLRRAAQRMELFRQAIEAVIPNTSLETPVPLTVVMLRDAATFRPFVWRSGRRNVGGYFLQAGDAAVIVFPASEFASGLSVAFHEYTHFLVQRSMGDAPSWFNEGLAELYSTFGGSEQDNRHLLGRPITHHLEFVRHRTLLPLDQMLTAEGAAKFLRDSSTVRGFYAQSWALVHYFVIGEGGRRASALVRFVEAQRKGEPFDEAFRTHFGRTPRELEKDLREYVRSLHFAAVEITFAGGQAPERTIERLSEARALQIQADVQMRIEEHEAAERKLDRALAIDPADVPSRTTLGRLRLRQGRAAEAVELFASVEAAAGSDAAVQTVYGDALRSVGRMREAAEHYERALALGSKAPATHFGLGVASMAQGRWGPAAVAFATVGRLDPSPSWQAERALATFELGLGLQTIETARLYLQRSEWSFQSTYVAFAAALGALMSGRGEQATPFLDRIDEHITTNAWAPVLGQFLRGQLGPADLMKRSSGSMAETEARTMIGYRALIDGRRDEAREQFAWVAKEGDRRTPFRSWAAAALARLDNAPPASAPASRP